MGRTGVTLFDVEQAALQLQGRGKTPSIDAIRDILGTGSKSTIGQHLKDWKSAQQEAQKKLPNELLSLVTGLWERLNNQADRRISDIEESHAEQEQALKQTIAQIQKEFSLMEKQNHQHEEALAKSCAENEALKNARLTLGQELAQLTERHNATLQQLDDHKKENTRLHQLANNIQSNLEHYQNAMQQLRTEQQLATEKQHAQFQQQLQFLQQELSQSRQQTTGLESQLQQLNTRHSELLVTQAGIKKENQQQAHEINLLTEQKHFSDQEIQDYKNNLTEKTTLANELEKQVALFNEKSRMLEKSLQAAEDKVETLRQENLFLAQEKAELQGALKQLGQVK